MENQHAPEIKLEMDIADFSGKTVSRIDIHNVACRTDPHKAGTAILMSFTDGSTGTILVRSGEVRITAAPYARPRMDNYSIVADEVVVQAP